MVPSGNCTLSDATAIVSDFGILCLPVYLVYLVSVKKTDPRGIEPRHAALEAASPPWNIGACLLVSPNCHAWLFRASPSRSRAYPGVRISLLTNAGWGS
jgi:hypothetical protein